MADHTSPPLQDAWTPLDQRRAVKARRLGTALHQLAADLARERRRTAQLERELADLRAERAASQNGNAPIRSARS